MSTSDTKSENCSTGEGDNMTVLPDKQPCHSCNCDEVCEPKDDSLFEDSCSEATESLFSSKDNSCLNDSMTLLDLPWEQVLSYHILPYLSVPDLFRLRAVSPACLELVQLHFSYSHVVNTSPFKDNFSPKAFEIMTRDCQSLRVLSVRGAKSWMTNGLLLKVIISNPRLEKIDLTGCIALSGASMYCIGVNCSHLKHLALRDCVWLTLDNFLSFLCNRRDIEFLDMSGCWNVNDDLVVNLVKTSPRAQCLSFSLKHLLMSNLYGLTDRAVVAVAHSCPNLIQLNLKGCWRITNQSIHLLSQFCPKLRFLQVMECGSVTEDSLKSLRSRGVRIDRLPPPSSSLARLEPLHRNNPHRDS
ncbi:F-box/LRR-repeat protein 15 isoform X2 [Aplysia californica]|uniref:F-box/LRR-repeat protein 15 isoform X2 n=1 Tax=Aplysia californica TaxID=6500 RepID=A0ABM1A2I8_APLCA|nr:F-box/LRR-repeat protein 15 isoform X2 [Aplysia californica]